MASNSRERVAEQLVKLNDHVYGMGSQTPDGMYVMYQPPYQPYGSQQTVMSGHPGPQSQAPPYGQGARRGAGGRGKHHQGEQHQGSALPPGVFVAEPMLQMQQGANGMYMMPVYFPNVAGNHNVLMPVYDPNVVPDGTMTDQLVMPNGGWEEQPYHPHNVQVAQWQQRGSLSKKKIAGAVRPDEVAALKRAVQEKMKGQPNSGTSTKTKANAGKTKQARNGDGDDEPVEGDSEASSEANDASIPVHQQFDFGFLLSCLGSTDEGKRQSALESVSKAFWPLALSKQGCRVVQKALDCSTPAYHLQLLQNLEGKTHDALQSPHANYVLQKIIKVVKPQKLQPIVQDLEQNVLYVARHRFGCRILQRLLEHCKIWQTKGLIQKVLDDAQSLCRHQYGNFILQHILKYGTPEQRSAVAQIVLADIMRLSKHRLASHIVSCALVHCATEDVQALLHAILHDQGKLYQLSRREYGSFVVREANKAALRLRGDGDENVTAEGQTVEDEGQGQDDGVMSEEDEDGIWDLDGQVNDGLADGNEPQ